MDWPWEEREVESSLRLDRKASDGNIQEKTGHLGASSMKGCVKNGGKGRV